MMRNADIIIFNQITGEDRREVFVPTMISGVFWYDVRSLNRSDRNREIGSRFVIRIPYDANVQDGRIYIPAEMYRKLEIDELKKYWTIQNNAYILRQPTVDIKEFILYPEDINKIMEENGDFVTVTEYADNTARGSNITKHWRIGGA